MPGTYPAGASVLSGDQLQISRFLQNPLYLQRRLRTFRDMRFVSDQLLTNRYRSQGGAVLYDMSEPFLTDRTVEAVDAGSTYPYANLPTGTAAIAAIQKWGQKVFLTDEEIARNIYGGAAVDRALQKVVNSIIAQVDSISMSAIASAVTQSVAVTTAWTAASPVMLRDILRAKAAIVSGASGTSLLGYTPDTVAFNDTQYAYFMSDPVITNAWRREATDNPIYNGAVERVAGLNIVVSPFIPTGTAYVLDSTALGGMADEIDAAPGYAVSDMAVQVKAIRQDSNDAWDLQGRRKTVPVVQEPAAGCKLTGVGV